MMMSKASLWSSSLLLASVANAQFFPVPHRPEGSFEYLQPLNTTILTQYGDSEPVYPSPEIKGTGGWEAALAKARDFVAELTLEEKRDMVTGAPGPCIGNIYPIPRLNFSGLCLQDGPASLRTADYVSGFPSGVTLASSWDKSFFYDKHLAQGKEFKGKGAHVALAPVAGPLGRSAFGGRNWEGFSSDPYLTGVAMEQSVKGFQDAGVQACAKHYLFNEQETLRNPAGNEDGTLAFEAISSNVDDRTTHELYLWPFANAVKAKAASFMCSYNRVNGSYGCQNSKLLNGLLKTELGFQGYVMTDWLASHSGVASIEAGLDMEMPGFSLPISLAPDGESFSTFFGGNITTGVKNGTIDETRLDDMVTRIMTPYYYLGQDVDFPSIDPSFRSLNTMLGPQFYFRDWNLTGEASRDVRSNHGSKIRKWAAESTILLKNEKNALPLKAPKMIHVFGNDAGEPVSGPLNQNDYEFGTLAVGGGSGASLFTYLITPLDALKVQTAKDGTLLNSWQNNTDIIVKADASGGIFGSVSGVRSHKEPDACLVFLKGWISEGGDRYSIDLDWNGNKLVEVVASTCSNTIVISHSSGINTLPFASNPNVTAILAAHYPGQESGNSIVDVLYGKVNPSGHLPYTIAYNATDYNGPITTGIQTDGVEDWQSWFDEKLEIDYRHFDAHDIDVRYEFGFGLSYTTFEMADLKVNRDKKSIPAEPPKMATAPGGNPTLWDTIYKAELTLSNTGNVEGKAVAQLYVTFPDSTPSGTPIRQLRGFDKLKLKPGESGVAKFNLHRRDLSYWNVEKQDWVIPSGEFKLSAGFSSRDLREFATFTII